jgi:hypothetical protein
MSFNMNKKNRQTEENGRLPFAIKIYVTICTLPIEVSRILSYVECSYGLDCPLNLTSNAIPKNLSKTQFLSKLRS